MHGLSGSDFGPALEQFLGTSHGLSPTTIGRLTAQWQADAAAFNARPLAGVDYVYMWVDGIHLKVRLEVISKPRDTPIPRFDCSPRPMSTKESE